MSAAIWLAISPAQPNPGAEDTVVEEIRVTAERLYRARASRPEPVLIYPREFFQHFDPVTVGEMLKRVSAVAFNEDIGEYGAPQLRGLGAEYTQVLINGQRLAGANADRRVLVDRIPAELVERIEVLRSPGADVDGQGVGGSIDIILRDGAALEGGRWEIGGLLQTEGSSDFRGNADLNWGRADDDRQVYGSLHYQQRLFPKHKTQRLFDLDGELEETTRSSDRRNDTDLSVAAGGSWRSAAGGTWSLDMGHIDTAIEERERLTVTGPEGEQAHLAEEEDVDQRRSLATLAFQPSWTGRGELLATLSVSRFREDQRLQEGRVEQGLTDPSLMESGATDDDEWSSTVRFDAGPGARHQVSAGLGASLRDRRAMQQRFEFEAGEAEDVTPGNGVYEVDEDRFHLFLQDRWAMGDSMEGLLGIRVEHNRLDQRGGEGRSRQNATEALPSLHLLIEPAAHRQIRLGLTRHLRRPAFDQLVPFIDQDNPDEDLITIGNPDLRPERAWGLDLGYEVHLGGGPGIVGINVFHRRIDDLIELTAIDESVYSPVNISRGKASGVELDVGLPLDGIGWREASLYLNAAWLDSEVHDPFIDQDRRFNFQPRYVANLDLLHRLPGPGLVWGFTLQKQGQARSQDLDEAKRIDYGANLGLFLERHFGDLRIRLSVDNLLDARKAEEVRLYDGLDEDGRPRLESRAREIEQIGPVLQLSVGGRF